MLTAGMAANAIAPITRAAEANSVAQAPEHADHNEVIDRNPRLPPDYRRLILPSSETALLVIDMIKEMCDERGKFTEWNIFRQIARRGTVARIQELEHAARLARIPVFFVALRFKRGLTDAPRSAPLWKSSRDILALEEESWGAEFIEALKPTDQDRVIFRQRISALDGTELDHLLRSSGIKRLILTGVTTNLAIEGTARQASDAGYWVVVPSDACASATDEWHEFSVNNMLPLFSRVSTTKKVIDVLGAIS
jgi:nicotinamidase-related amidase